jgi:ssDNA-binding Zn-finger/Zn-ribbon topoisomerase 1
MYECPKCNTKVALEENLDWECPNCGHGLNWEKQYSDNYSDSWWTFEWDKIKGD